MLRFFFFLKLLLCIRIKNWNLVTLHHSCLLSSPEGKSMAQYVRMPVRRQRLGLPQMLKNTEEMDMFTICNVFSKMNPLSC